MIRTARRADLDLIASGSWVKAGRKTYRHASGIVVRYDHNRFTWEIVGGAEDGYHYTTLTVAAHSATRHLAA